MAAPVRHPAAPSHRMAAPVRHPAAPSHQVNQGAMIISRSPKDQCNIDPGRHADEGSSSCPLIVARASIFALFKDWKPKEAREFEQLMRLSVKQWDTTSGAVNGKAPADVVERTATTYNVTILTTERNKNEYRKKMEYY